MNAQRHFLLSALIVIGTAIITACSHQADVTPAATPVHVMAAKPGPGAAEVVTTGIVAAKDESKLSFKIGGIIQRIAVREGEQVKAGQLLAELNPTEINAQLQQAQQLNDKAQRDEQRGERLYADQVIPLAQLQDLRTQAKVAAAQLQAAKFNQRHASIVAPTAGTILRKLAEEHELVAPAQPILVFGASDKGFVVRSALSDRDAVQLHVGDTATVKMDAFAGKEFSGYLSEIGGAAQVDSGLFPIEVHLKNVKERLVSGLVAQVSIQPQLANNESLLYVPTGAVVSGVGRRADLFVLSHENGQDVARRHEVTVAFFSRDQVALSNGIQAGDKVITDGALYLNDGEHVSVQAQ